MHGPWLLVTFIPFDFPPHPCFIYVFFNHFGFNKPFKTEKGHKLMGIYIQLSTEKSKHFDEFDLNKPYKQRNIINSWAYIQLYLPKKQNLYLLRNIDFLAEKAQHYVSITSVVLELGEGKFPFLFVCIYHII